TSTFQQLIARLREQGEVTAEYVAEVLARVQGKKVDAVAPIDVVNVARRIVPRTQGQARYVQSIRDNEITFAIGPAGTGKTYLAVAVAVEALKNHQIRKIVLVRPAVEAGESLGYLPGD